ncbi:MAG: hypothetical protein AABX51_01865 [Nanoarchaeota archaeon]
MKKHSSVRKLQINESQNKFFFKQLVLISSFWSVLAIIGTLIVLRLALYPNSNGSFVSVLFGIIQLIFSVLFLLLFSFLFSLTAFIMYVSSKSVRILSLLFVIGVILFLSVSAVSFFENSKGDYRIVNERFVYYEMVAIFVLSSILPSLMTLYILKIKKLVPDGLSGGAIIYLIIMVLTWVISIPRFN